MTKYRTLLFDIDDTLLDFGEAEKIALRLLFQEQNIPATAEIYEKYKEINQGLWRAYEEGTIDREEVLNTRFSRLFQEFGQEVDGVLFEQKYRLYLEEGHHLIDGAIDLITDLQPQYELYVVTNGVSRTQYRRLKDSGLFPLFKDVFVSEDTGFQKPMKEYFDFVSNRIPRFSPGKALIIGDSLTSDIKGGNMAGLDTCWFNPNRKTNQSDIVPTYEIQRLEELYTILS